VYEDSHLLGYDGALMGDRFQIVWWNCLHLQESRCLRSLCWDTIHVLLCYSLYSYAICYQQFAICTRSIF